MKTTVLSATGRAAPSRDSPRCSIPNSLPRTVPRILVRCDSAHLEDLLGVRPGGLSPSALRLGGGAVRVRPDRQGLDGRTGMPDAPEQHPQHDPPFARTQPFPALGDWRADPASRTGGGRRAALTEVGECDRTDRERRHPERLADLRERLLDAVGGHMTLGAVPLAAALSRTVSLGPSINRCRRIALRNGRWVEAQAGRDRRMPVSA